jgi:5-formyltetrahydrofolate cyclo-ligase
VGAATRLVALVGDDELVEGPLPAEPHDVAVHAVWRPRAGVTSLPIQPSRTSAWGPR